MRPEVGWNWPRWAVLVWSVLLLALGARAALQPRQRSLYPTWTTAGGDWLAGADLYRSRFDPPLDQFRYSPPVAALLAPWHLLPEHLGAVLWRLLNAGVFLGGFAWWLKAAAPAPVTARQRGVLFLLLVPLALGSLNNAQPNPLLIGLLLAGLAAAARRRWFGAGCCIALATAFKVYPLALGLLLLLVYPRRFALPLLAALLLLAALPFLAQQPDYVARQYVLWYERLRPCDSNRRFWEAKDAYRDLWLLLRVWNVPVGLRAYALVQAALAAGCALLCLTVRWRGWPRRQVLLTALTLATAWMMLCGPATESSTYVFLAPALAWSLVRARPDGWPALGRHLAEHGCGLLLLCVLAGLTAQTASFHALGLHPLGVVLFVAGYLIALARALKTNTPHAKTQRRKEEEPSKTMRKAGKQERAQAEEGAFPAFLPSSWLSSLASWRPGVRPFGSLRAA
jgi:hypothetical protein